MTRNENQVESQDSSQAQLVDKTKVKTLVLD